MTRGTQTDTRTLRLLAVAADCDERSVARYLRGERIRTASVRARIVEACRVAGLEPARPRTTEAVVAQELVRA